MRGGTAIFSGACAQARAARRTGNASLRTSAFALQLLAVPHLAPGLAELGADVAIGLIVVGETQVSAVPHQLTGDPHGDGGEQHPFAEGARDAEVRVRR